MTDTEPNKPTSSSSIPQMSEYTIHLIVGGTPFLLDPDAVAKFNSSFLSTLLDPQSEFQKPQDGIFTVDADSECFSAFLHMVRYGSIPEPFNDEGKRQLFLDQADFWCIKPRVVEAFTAAKGQRGEEMKANIRQYRTPQQRLKDVCSRLAMSKVHHNHRYDDCNGRIYCSLCHNRDIDSRWYQKDGSIKYTSCKSCNRDVMYRPDLDWCHQCSLCERCQGGGECKADCHVSSRSYYEKSTTKELEEEANLQIERVILHRLV